MTELLNLIFGRNLDEAGTKKRDFYRSAIPHFAQTAEAYMNPSSLLRTLSQPAKRDLAAAFRRAFKGGGRATSAINMAWGKRRSYRARRPAYRRKPYRKRTYKRKSYGRKRTTASSSLAVLKKALGGNMSY